MIDYDDSAAEALKIVTEKMKELDSEKVKKKLEVSDELWLIYLTVYSKELVFIHFIIIIIQPIMIL